MPRQPPCLSDVAHAFPRPNKDVGYFYYGAVREPPRGSAGRPRYLPAARPLTWGGEPWPRRQPSLEDARVGDVIAGNIELRASCSCGHSTVIGTEVLRARHEPTQMLRYLAFRCRQCGGSATLGHGVSMRVLKDGR